VREDADSVLWLDNRAHRIVTNFQKRVIIRARAVRGQGKVERHADSLARHSTEGIAVKEVRIFTLNIRDEVSLRPGDGVHPRSLQIWRLLFL